MKQLNGIESDRQSVITVTRISIKCICCKQIKIQKLNRYDVSQYYCVTNLKGFFFLFIFISLLTWSQQYHRTNSTCMQYGIISIQRLCYYI